MPWRNFTEKFAADLVILATVAWSQRSEGALSHSPSSFQKVRLWCCSTAKEPPVLPGGEETKFKKKSYYQGTFRHNFKPNSKLKHRYNVPTRLVPLSRRSRVDSSPRPVWCSRRPCPSSRWGQDAKRNPMARFIWNIL